MMSDNEIRTLLNEFYSGTICDQDEDRLARFFSEADYENLPDDIKSSYSLFSGLRSIRGLKCPDIVRPVHNLKMPFKMPFFGYALASLVAALLITGGIILIPRTHYGYDFDGKIIVSAEKALEEMEELNMLALLKDNEETIHQMFDN